MILDLQFANRESRMYPLSMRPHNGMKAQDSLVLLKIVDLGKESWLAKDLAASIGLSPTEVSMSLERSRYAKLLDDSKRRVNTKAFLDFLVHGLRVVFPVQPGGLVRGIPTAWSAKPLSETFKNANPVVWPSENGKLRGEAIEPLYPSVTKAVANSAALHELLALVDALRIGRSREIESSARILRERFDAYAHLAEH